MNIRLTILLAALWCSATPAWGIIVPVGNHEFDGVYGNVNFLAFDGSNFTTPLAAPIANFDVSVDNGALGIQQYPGASFIITGGFAEVSTTIVDLNNSLTPDLGDSVITSIGPGAFEIVNGSGTILFGVFNSGLFSSSIGSSAGAAFSADVLGLDLTPGPEFKFDTTSVAAIADPEGFGFSLSDIPGGVTASLIGQISPGFLAGNLNAFDLSDGSVTVSGEMLVVPEPSSIVLAGFTLHALLRRPRRRSIG